MGFADALKLIQRSPGCRVARSSWPIGEDHVVVADERVSIVHAPSRSATEYSPSQEDMAATDWEIVR